MEESTGMNLEEWLALLFDPPDGASFINYAFPTDRHREEYFATINQRTDEEVYKLLKRFLIPSGTLGIDKLRLAGLAAIQKADPEMFQRMIRLQYYQRLVLNASGYDKVQPWEGITWVLDLLPHFPKQALEGLNAYILVLQRYFAFKEGMLLPQPNQREANEHTATSIVGHAAAIGPKK